MIQCPKSFLFSYGSWGCSYYVGVYKAMVNKWGYNKLNKCAYGGVSSGCIISLAICLGYPWEYLEKVYLELSDQAEKYGVMGKMSSYHTKAIDKLLKNKEDYLKVNNRLFLGVTYFYNKFRIISHWENNEELINTLHAAFHIPYYCTYTQKIKNNIAIDGALSMPYFKIDKKTLIIGAMLKPEQGHIVCKPKLSKKDVYKPSIYKYFIIRDRGYKDMLSWDGVYKTLEKSKQNYIMLSFYWLLRYSEEVL